MQARNVSSYSRLQKVSIWVLNDLGWCSFCSSLWGWGTVIFQLSGCYQYCMWILFFLPFFCRDLWPQRSEHPDCPGGSGAPSRCWWPSAAARGFCRLRLPEDWIARYRTQNPGRIQKVFQCSYGVDYRILRWIYFLDPTRGGWNYIRRYHQYFWDNQRIWISMSIPKEALPS